jgi:hypothetical protein
VTPAGSAGTVAKAPVPALTMRPSESSSSDTRSPACTAVTVIPAASAGSVVWPKELVPPHATATPSLRNATAWSRPPATAT